MHVVQRRLANGLLVNLIQDTGAPRAAALVQLAAGSHHEPDAWPGLAHLLEHVLFAGSEGYQDAERLMAWVPAQGGRLNATTRGTATAWFVEVAAPDLSEATARLVDMLQRPLLTADAVRQETAVIDAEYRMLTHHSETLCEAALSRAFTESHPLHRFQAGNLACFGKDTAALQQALRDYHQRFFHAERLTLWLQGPQPLEELSHLADQWGGAFRPAATVGNHSEQVLTSEINSTLTLRPERWFRLHRLGEERLQLSVIIDSPAPWTFALLQELLLDSASCSLLTALRTRGLCDEIRLLEPYRSDEQAVLSVEFQLCDATVAFRTAANGSHRTVAAADAMRPATVEAIFCHWLSLLAALTTEQLRHYAALSRSRFIHLSALDQLRTQAFGFPPADEPLPALPGEWQNLLSQLQPDRMTRLWITPDVMADEVAAQGFTLNLKAARWPDYPSGGQTFQPAMPALGFYPGAFRPVPPSLPSERAALRHVPSAGEATLLLNPAAGQLSDGQAALVEASLQTLSGECRHHGGELAFERHQGIWLLRLSGCRDLMLSALSEINARLRAPTSADRAQGMRLAQRTEQKRVADIAVRCLLARLPGAIAQAAIAVEENGSRHATASENGTAPESAPGTRLRLNSEVLPDVRLTRIRWEATLYGGDGALHQALSRLLSRFPGEVIARPLPVSVACKRSSASARQPDQWHDDSPAAAARFSPAVYVCPTESRDAAVILFCPLVEQSAECLAAWQVLGALFEPRFFHQLRVEKNIGYVVSCRFQQMAGVAGLLFALQSPTLPAETLYGYMVDFMASMHKVIDALTAETLKEKARALRLTGTASRPDTAAAVLQEWQKNQLPLLTPETLNRLSPACLRGYYHRLTAEPQRWVGLSNQPLPFSRHPAAAADR